MSSPKVFGTRNEPHTIIIAKGQSVSHFTVRPWVLAFAGAIVTAICFGYLAGTSYLIFRDDFINASMARQARMQHAYEDRISELRNQVDRITSHRLLDQQVMETKLAELMTRQNVLAERSSVASSVLERAAGEGLGTSSRSSLGGMPIPVARPGAERAEVLGLDTMTTGSIASAAAPGKIEQTLSAVTNKLQTLEASQIAHVTNLRHATLEKAEQLAAKARASGLSVKAAMPEETGLGGPLLPPRPSGVSEAFSHEVERLDAALDALDKTRDRIRAFPIAHPAPGESMSSRFGNRSDPFTRRKAFHAGLDFRTPTGTPILAAATGRVVFSGRRGGYGKLVEIEHANGLSTRYAHLSRLKVRKGQQISAGQVVGDAGSTGRSTGPHLHYEVRRGGKPINPINFLNAGTKLAADLRD
ncbi:MAG: M23 family metallopeptidase [Pseudomonadota bacterium]